MSTANGDPQLSNAERAERGADWAYTTMGRVATTANNAARLELRENAMLHARIAETFAIRDQAEANRDLARAQTQLALSMDRLVDELARRRGEPEQAQ